jgi:hypothetical protein
VRRGLFGRLLSVMCGVAAASTGLALLLQERSLSSDLERAAERRLAAAATAADRLLEGHLSSTAERYRAVSGTPQFRATLEVNDAPTLEHYAETLLDQQRAARIAFVDAVGTVVAAAGAEELDAQALEIRGEGVVARAGTTYAVVTVPIARAGRLVAVEPIASATLVLWSELCGARVSFAPTGAALASGIRKVVREVDGIERRVESSLDA